MQFCELSLKVLSVQTPNQRTRSRSNEMGEKQASARAGNSTRPMNAMFVRRRTPNRTKAPLANQKVSLILAPVLRPSMHAVCLNLPQPKAACGLRSNRQKINVFHPICVPSFDNGARASPSRLGKNEEEGGRGGLLPSSTPSGSKAGGS